MNNNHLNLHYKDACHWLESRIVSVLSCHWLLRPLILGHNEDQQVQDKSSVFHGVHMSVLGKLVLIQNCSLLTGSLKKMNNYYIYIENKIDCKNSHTSRQE